MYILYKTTNLVNGKYYIGVTNDTKPYYKGSGTALYEAFRVHGRKNFKREDLETFKISEEAFAREAEVVNKAFVKDRNTYNIKVGGKGGIGQRKTAEHRRKLSESVKRSYKYRNETNKGGRKPITPPAVLVELVERLGKRKAAIELGISLVALQSRYYRLRNQVE